VNTLLRLCAAHQIDPAIPFSDTDLCYLLYLYAEGHKVTTVPLFLSAVQYFARRRWGIEFTFPKGRQLHETLTALRHKYASDDFANAKVPITMADLVAFHAALDRRYFEHARTWCAALLAFFGLLRISEYCAGALRIGDVSPEPYGLDIVIRRSKTTTQPVRISLALRPDILCPLAALRHYASFFPLLRIPCGPSDPLFVVRIGDGTRLERLQPAHFIEDVRSLIRLSFPAENARGYAGHSFRRGGTTAMLQAGVPQVIVQRHGRWASDAFKRYLDSASSPATRVIATQALIHAPITIPRVLGGLP
jgi:integrase